MATTISGSTGVNKITDGTIVNADIAGGAAIAGSKIVTGVKNITHVELNPIWNGSGSQSGHNAWSMLGNTTVTPSSSSSKLIIHWTCGYIKAHERTGVDFGLAINGTQVSDALGHPTGSMQYLGHRVSVNGTGYFQTGGTMVYNCTSTTAFTLGLCIRVYDESLGWSVGAGHNSFPVRLIIEDVVL